MNHLLEIQLEINFNIIQCCEILESYFVFISVSVCEKGSKAVVHFLYGSMKIAGNNHIQSLFDKSFFWFFFHYVYVK